MASLLFYVGLAVGYVIVFPLTLRFLGTYQVSESVANQISLGSYIGMFLKMNLIMGVVFELPALAYMLSRIGIINRQMLRRIYHDSSGTADIYALRGLHQAVQQ